MPHIKPEYLEPQRGTGYHGAFHGIAAEAITAGDIVIVAGVSGDKLKWKQADANLTVLMAGVMGVADHTVASGAELRVVSHKIGKVLLAPTLCCASVDGQAYDVA